MRWCSLRCLAVKGIGPLFVRRPQWFHVIAVRSLSSLRSTELSPSSSSPSSLRVPPTDLAPTGLQLRSDQLYPSLVVDMVELIHASPATQQLKAGLAPLAGDVRAASLLLRHFATNDDLGNAFRVLHVMKELGIPRERETYRYLMYGCCKYADNDLGLYVLENMVYENKPDFVSFKRLFDAMAVGVDLRLWVAYDAMMWFYPLKGAPSAALRTTAYITEIMWTIGLGPSARAGRGFITLPNPRGELADPMALMFSDSDPHYPHEDVMRLGAISSEDGNNLRISAGSSEASVVANKAGSSSEVAARDAETVSATPTVKVQGKVVHVWANATFTTTVELAADTSRDPDVYRRLRLVAEEFEDRNRLKKIVERNRRREANEAETVPGEQLQLQGWSSEAIAALVRSERESEWDHLLKLEASQQAVLVENAIPVPSMKKVLRDFWTQRWGSKKQT